MNRKEFFRNLLLGGLGAALPKSLDKLAPLPLQKIRLAVIYLAGFQFYDGPEALSLLEPDMPLQLNREPHNPYDKNAIQVLSGEARLGYIPRSENKTIAGLMDQGKTIEAVILEINPDSFPGGSVKAEVFYYRNFSPVSA
jgi:hypothetical protein